MQPASAADIATEHYLTLQRQAKAPATIGGLRAAVREAVHAVVGKPPPRPKPGPQPDHGVEPVGNAFIDLTRAVEGLAEADVDMREMAHKILVYNRNYLSSILIKITYTAYLSSNSTSMAANMTAELTRLTAQELQDAAAAYGSLLMWLVTDVDPVYRGKLVAHPHITDEHGGQYMPSVLVADTLSELRAQMPARLKVRPRDPFHLPAILETWG